MSSAPEHRSWKVSAYRPDPRIAVFDVEISDYREFFIVAEGEKSLTITMLDRSDPTYLEPQVFCFAKPHDWCSDLADDEALLQVWQVVGLRR